MTNRLTDPTVTMQNDQLRLTMLRVSDKRYIPPAVLANTEMEVWRDETLGGMVVSLSTHVLADQIANETVVVDRWVEVETWESWWQHTKAVHFPTISRWLRRDPRQHLARTKVSVEFNHKRFYTFPESKTYPHELGKPVIVDRITWDTPGPGWEL